MPNPGGPHNTADSATAKQAEVTPTIPPTDPAPGDVVLVELPSGRRFLDLGNGQAHTLEFCNAAGDHWLSRAPLSGRPCRPADAAARGSIVNMGHDLTRMARASSILAELTAGEQGVVLVLADICMDKTRKPPANMNAGHQVCEDLGIALGTLGNILASLGRRGVELRVPIGTDKRGRPVYAVKGHALDFRFPILAPRDLKAPLRDGPLESELVDNRRGASQKGPLSSGPLPAKVHSPVAKGPSVSGPLPPETPSSKDDPEPGFLAAQPEVETSSGRPVNNSLPKTPHFSGDNSKTTGQIQEPGSGRPSPRTRAETAEEARRQADALNEWMRQHPEAAAASS